MTNATCATARRSACSLKVHWQEGLLPVHGVGASTLAQYRRFAQLVGPVPGSANWTIPVSKSPASARSQGTECYYFRSLSGAESACWIRTCAGTWTTAAVTTTALALSVVSAWAGIHYFASRHGFHAARGRAASDDEPPC